MQAGSLALLGSLFLSLACGGDAHQQRYAAAAVGAGALVAGTALNRAITNDCWARCRSGYLCNEASGLCEPGECLPGCPVGSHCVRDVRGQHLCVQDQGGVVMQFERPPASVPPVDAGAPETGPDAAPLATDAAAADASFDAPDAEATAE